MILRKPAYFDSFRCIAGACPDSCCKDWAVQVDDTSAAYYRSLPGQLGDRLREVLQEEDDDTILTITDGRCPMWRNDGLCRIQAELGEEALCHTCRAFPRLTHDYGNFVEQDLELSCPEAARILLNAPFAPAVTVKTPEQVVPEYEKDVMDILLSSRQQALELLSPENLPVGRRLALLLLYACQVQSALDGGELGAFDPESAWETVESLPNPEGLPDILPFFRELEILTKDWKALLDAPHPGSWDPHIPAMARYLVNRYWLQAVSDYDLYSRAKLVCILCLLVRELGGNIFRTAQLMSKEIENDADNLEAILDAAYTNPIFNDIALLRWLQEA